jgi:hypothetical protein
VAGVAQLRVHGVIAIANNLDSTLPGQMITAATTTYGW